MDETVDVRIRIIGDDRDWKEIPVALEFASSNLAYVRSILHRSMNRLTVREIRLNYRGSQQGSYIE